MRSAGIVEACARRVADGGWLSQKRRCSNVGDWSGGSVRINRLSYSELPKATGSIAPNCFRTFGTVLRCPTTMTISFGCLRRISLTTPSMSVCS